MDFSSTQMHGVWAQCAEKSAADAVDFLFERLVAFSAGGAAHDDITATVLKVLP
jgi:serine phosphatase RsbU (regulator of sigma subunit)